LKEFSRFARLHDPYAAMKQMETAKNNDGSPVYSPRVLGILSDMFGGKKAQDYHDKIEAASAARKTEADEAAKLKAQNNPEAIAGDAKRAAAVELAKQNTPQGRATLAKTLVETTKAKAEAAGAGTDKMWAEGQNPITNEKLNLSNAPDEMLLDSRTSKPIPFKMLSTLKPNQTEIARATFADSVIHSLDKIDELKAQGKLPNGPLSGLTQTMLAKVGFGNEDAQKALDFISFAQSAATGAHVGGRFSVPVLEKMNKLVNLNMNDGQFKGAEESIRDVMGQYSKQGGRQTVGQFKQDLLGSVVSVKGQRVKVTGFDKDGNIQGMPVQQ
jgi:hypothetical protein